MHRVRLPLVGVTEWWVHDEKTFPRREKLWRLPLVGLTVSCQVRNKKALDTSGLLMEAVTVRERYEARDLLVRGLRDRTLRSGP